MSSDRPRLKKDPVQRWTPLAVSEFYRKHFGTGRLLVATHREPIIYPRPFRSGEIPPPERARLRYPGGGVSQSLHRLLLQVGGDWVSLQSSPGPDHLSITLPGYPSGYDLYRLTPSTPLSGASYHHFSNDIIWPLFHEEPGRMEVGPGFFSGYDAINRDFAMKIGKILGDHDVGVVWIHDYQLALVASWLRGSIRTLRSPLACFWHIPWPGPEFLTLLPERKILLSALLEYDLLGFQTDLYRDRFLESAVREFSDDPGFSLTGTLIRKNGRTTTVGAYPIGVDPGRFEILAQDPGGMEEASRFLGLHGIGPEDPFLISVDRMDYTKGFLKRMLILETLFRNFPEWIGKIRLLQIAPPTRTSHPAYQTYQKNVRNGVNATNERWKREGWTPVVSVESTVDHQILAPLYRKAVGALVTSTNDGMNLVAKEYLSAQKGEGGVLFLSRYTGAAQGLKEAVLIDPFDPEMSAGIIHNFLRDPRSIRTGRNQILREQISRNNIYQWMGSILESVSTLALM